MITLTQPVAVAYTLSVYNEQTTLVTSIISSASTGGSINGSSEEIPTGAIDGVNTVFALAHVSNNKIFALMLNGLNQYPIDDFTLSGASITFVVAPSTGAKIQATYTY